MNFNSALFGVGAFLALVGALATSKFTGSEYAAIAVLCVPTSLYFIVIAAILKAQAIIDDPPKLTARRHHRPPRDTTLDI